MHIALSFEAFATMPYTTGILQNISDRATIEIRPEYIDNGGLVLKPGEKYRFRDSTIYARSLWEDKTAVVAVVPASAGGGSGGGDGDGEIADKYIATDDEIDEILDEIFDEP